MVSTLTLQIVTLACLQIYPDISVAKFAVILTPISGDDLGEVKAAKAARRKMIQTFTQEGQPGEALAPHVESLAAALQCPEDMMKVRARV